jgi:hypothetical protein
MAQLSHEQYERLERAITERRRIVVYRRGTEYVVLPLRLETAGGRETILARNPSTGDDLLLRLDEIDGLELV